MKQDILYSLISRISIKTTYLSSETTRQICQDVLDVLECRMIIYRGFVECHDENKHRHVKVCYKVSKNDLKPIIDSFQIDI